MPEPGATPGPLGAGKRRDRVPEEGVIRFRAEHRDEPLPAGCTRLLRPLVPWRRTLRARGLLGREPGRYGGYGFGNLSVAVPPAGRAEGGAGPFLVSGTQTSGDPRLDPQRFVLVESWSHRDNRVASRGPVVPSSESLSHAAVYDAAAAAGIGVGAVFHVHSQELWSLGRAAGLPATRAEHEAGTAAMAGEILDLFAEGRVVGKGVLVMGGHRDGALAFGRDPDEAGRRLLAALLAVRSQSFRLSSR